MTVYRCLVVTPEGLNDWRSVDAPSESGALARMMAAGLTPIEIRSGSPGLMERLNRPVRLGRALTLSEQALILTQLATLAEAGLPIDRSLDLLREQAPKASQRDALAEILANVRSGESLASALAARQLFPGYVTGVLRSAERSGRMSEALRSLAQRMSKVAATRRLLVTALTYPAAVLAATFIALFLVLTLVVPQFEPVFAGEEARLPTLTVVVLALSGAATEHGLLLLATLVLPPVGLFYWLRTESGAAFLDRHKRRIPGLRLRDQLLAAQLTGLLSTLLANGVTVVEALPLARGAIGSKRWRASIAQAERRVREGSSLARALREGALMPPTAIRLIEVGERSGRLAQTCGHAGTILDEAARARIDRIVALANPAAIISLGAIVALLIAGVMLGIFAMGDFAA